MALFLIYLESRPHIEQKTLNKRSLHNFFSSLNETLSHSYYRLPFANILEWKLKGHFQNNMQTFELILI